MDISSIVTWIGNNWSDVLNIVAYTIAGASIVVKLTPSVEDDTILAKVISLLKTLSLYKEVK
jgi:SepF-like predicted cell division protein (DUF552 family)